MFFFRSELPLTFRPAGTCAASRRAPIGFRPRRLVYGGSPLESHYFMPNSTYRRVRSEGVIAVWSAFIRELRGDPG